MSNYNRTLTDSQATALLDCIVWGKYPDDVWPFTPETQHYWETYLQVNRPDQAEQRLEILGEYLTPEQKQTILATVTPDVLQRAAEQLKQQELEETAKKQQEEQAKILEIQSRHVNTIILGKEDYGDSESTEEQSDLVDFGSQYDDCGGTVSFRDEPVREELPSANTPAQGYITREAPKVTPSSGDPQEWDQTEYDNIRRFALVGMPITFSLVDLSPRALSMMSALMGKAGPKRTKALKEIDIPTTPKWMKRARRNSNADEDTSWYIALEDNGQLSTPELQDKGELTASQIRTLARKGKIVNVSPGGTGHDALWILPD